MNLMQVLDNGRVADEFREAAPPAGIRLRSCRRWTRRSGRIAAGIVLLGMLARSPPVPEESRFSSNNFTAASILVRSRLRRRNVERGERLVGNRKQNLRHADSFLMRFWRDRCNYTRRRLEPGPVECPDPDTGWPTFVPVSRRRGIEEGGGSGRRGGGRGGRGSS